MANKLRLNIRAAAKEIDVDLGDTFSANTGTECEALSNAQIGLEILGEDIVFPEDGYHGDDIIETVKHYIDENGTSLREKEVEVESDED